MIASDSADSANIQSFLQLLHHVIFVICKNLCSSLSARSVSHNNQFDVWQQWQQWHWYATHTQSVSGGSSGKRPGNAISAQKDIILQRVKKGQSSPANLFFFQSMLAYKLRISLKIKQIKNWCTQYGYASISIQNLLHENNYRFWWTPHCNQWRIHDSQVGRGRGGQPLRWGAKLFFGQNFPENCIKWMS